MAETLAVVPARGGSKRLPRKNVTQLAGLPLIVHSLRLAALCPEIGRTIVSTDSEEVAAVALAAGADVPFRRPPELARDETPMLPVLQHALAEVDPRGDVYGRVLLLDPTSPGRLPGDVAAAHELLEANPDADGVVAVSEPPFNPAWTAVVERQGYLEPLVPDAYRFGRSQDVPRVLRINAALYLFRASFVREPRRTWLDGRHLALEIPEERAFHIDSERDLELCELVLRAGLVQLPWLVEPSV
jgi:CMP-N,N'-diacetyllegionaminic acid synthase